MSLHLIQHIVARHYGLTREDLISQPRLRRLAYPRMVAMTLCREMTQATFERIARAFRRDHTTIISAIRRCAKEPELTETLEKLRPIIQIALELAELDTLSMRVHTAQMQQLRWPDSPPPKPKRPRPPEYYKRAYARKLARRLERIRAVGPEAYRPGE